MQSINKALIRFSSSPTTYLLLVAAAVLAYSIWLSQNNVLPGNDSIGFFFLGIFGAIFANSTGAGGGVVFIPVFNQLGLNEAQSVATSFGIQCFGMTAGAITWYRYRRRQYECRQKSWQSFAHILLVGTTFSIAGLWSNYSWDISAPAELNKLFRIFSLLLGISILIAVYMLKSSLARNMLTLFDFAMLAAIGFSGGMVTGWLSVGVGEAIAFYLILRRFDVTMAIATAVIISAFTVWASTPNQFWLNSDAHWQVIAFAGPGAIMGGLMAKTLVSSLSAIRLKLFFAIWLIIIGLVG